MKAADEFHRRLRHQLFEYTVIARDRYAAKGRPSKDAQPEQTEWYTRGRIRDDEGATEESRIRKGMFVIAMNEMH